MVLRRDANSSRHSARVTYEYRGRSHELYINNVGLGKPQCSEKAITQTRSAVLVWVFLRLTSHSCLGLHHQTAGVSNAVFVIGLQSGFTVITVLSFEKGMLVLPLAHL